jgi:hypothetical protein
MRQKNSLVYAAKNTVLSGRRDLVIEMVLSPSH